MNKDFLLRISSKGPLQPIYILLTWRTVWGRRGHWNRFLLHGLFWLGTHKDPPVSASQVAELEEYTSTSSKLWWWGKFLSLFVVGQIKHRSSDILSTHTTTELNPSGSLKQKTKAFHTSNPLLWTMSVCLSSPIPLPSLFLPSSQLFRKEVYIALNGTEMLIAGNNLSIFLWLNYDRKPLYNIWIKPHLGMSKTQNFWNTNQCFWSFWGCALMLPRSRSTQNLGWRACANQPSGKSGVSLSL